LPHHEEGSDAVLRISRNEDAERGRVTLRVEGRLVASSAGLLESRCRSLQCEAPRPALDLSGVTFIDGRGVGLLRRLRGAGFEIVNCPAFVEGLLPGAADR
jgi:anti-anti-sigma regulatory factor